MSGPSPAASPAQAPDSAGSGRDPVTLTRALLRCPSVTPDAGAALDLLAAVLAGAGFRIERHVFREPGTADVDNLFAVRGQGHPHLAFAGHVDVVPAGDEAAWSAPPFAGEARDGHLIGRGAVDMKGAVAAAVAAALRHGDRAGAGSGTLSFLLTGDEEGPSVNGTAKLAAALAERGLAPDHCLLGEPTNPDALGDAIKIGRRGSFSALLEVDGVQGHVAYPHRTVNPIRALVRLLAALDAPLDAGSAWFEPSHLEVTDIAVGNPAFNVVPGRAQARFNVRFNDAHSLESLERLLRARLDAAAQGARYRLTPQRGNSDSFLTEPCAFTALVAEAIEGVTGRRPALSTGGGTSDARFLKRYGPVVEFGLVGATMHQVDERVPLADLETLTRIYEAVLEAYFSRGGAASAVRAPGC